MKTVIYIIGPDGPEMGSDKHPRMSFRTGPLLATLAVPFAAEESVLRDMHSDVIYHGLDGTGFFRGDSLVIHDDRGIPFHSYYPEEIISEMEKDDGFDYGLLPAMLKTVPEDHRCCFAELKD